MGHYDKIEEHLAVELAERLASEFKQHTWRLYESMFCYFIKVDNKTVLEDEKFIKLFGPTIQFDNGFISIMVAKPKEILWGTVLVQEYIGTGDRN